jgi:hypothetical protein
VRDSAAGTQWAIRPLTSARAWSIVSLEHSVRDVVRYSILERN